MATATSPETEAKPRSIRFKDESGEWIEMEVTDSKMLAQIRNLHDKKQEEVHSKARETFRKTVDKLVKEQITDDLEVALDGQAIVYRIGSGEDADDEVMLIRASLVTVRTKARRSDAKD